MSNTFGPYGTGLTSPARSWGAKINAATAVDFRVDTDRNVPRALFCCAAGNVVITGENGVSTSFPVLASQELHCMPLTLENTTTVAVIPMW